MCDSDIQRFSVIIPVYNSEKYLNQCIDSVLNQSYQNYELILVDDGSSDCSGFLCDKYQKQASCVKVIHKQNEGVCLARKDGVAAASGEYIIFLDSDDYFNKDMLQHMSDCIDQYSPDVVFSNLVHFSEKGDSIIKNEIASGCYEGDNRKIVYEKLIYDNAGRYCISCHNGGKAFRRSSYKPFLEQVPESLYIWEDYAAIAPYLLHCNSICFTDYCDYYYRNNEHSIVNSFRYDLVDQIKLLASYLSVSMGDAYQNKINNLVMRNYNTFLFRNRESLQSFTKFREVLFETLDDELRCYLKNAEFMGGGLKNRFFHKLMHDQRFLIIWAFRKCQSFLS